MTNKKQPDLTIETQVTGLGLGTRVGLGFIIISLIVFLLHAGAPILIPFVMAVFVWYLINALSRGLENYGMPRFAGRLLAILFLIAAIWFVSRIISANVGEVFRAASLYQKKLVNFLPTLLAAFPDIYKPEAGDIAEILDISGMLKGLAQSFTGFAGKALVVLFYTGFLLYEQKFFSRKLHEIAQNRAAETRVQNVIANIDQQMQHYISVKTFVSLMAGAFTWALFSAYGLSFPGFWGVMVFFFSFVPYVGPLAAVILPGLIGLLQIGEVYAFLPFIAGLCAIQILWSVIIDARLMGSRLNLSPMFILLSIAAWGSLWGAPGMFLAVPILTTMIIVLAQFPKTHGVAVLLSRTGQVQQ